MDDKNKMKKKSILYTSKDLKIYSNIDAASEAEALYVTNQDPLDRIKETVQLILRIFPLIKKTSGNDKIYIDKE